MKIVVFGLLFNGDYSYLRSGWNIMDFVIVVISVISLTPLSNTLQIIKMFRILRILRLISKNSNLQVAVKALFLALPNVLNTIIIVMLFFFIFGIFLVSFLKGKFYSCMNLNLNEVMQSSGMAEGLVYDSDADIYVGFFPEFPGMLKIEHKWDCLASGGEWVNSDQNFDNLYKAVANLFIMSTGASWTKVMYYSASSTDIDYVHVTLNEPFWIIFYIIFTILANFFLMNIFVGVVISTFNSEHDKISGSNLLTEKQREWIDTRLLVLKSSPIAKLKEPDNWIRKLCFKIV